MKNFYLMVFLVFSCTTVILYLKEYEFLQQLFIIKYWYMFILCIISFALFLRAKK